MKQKRETVLASHGYSLAAEALVLAYALRREGESDKAKQVLASILDCDDIDVFVKKLDADNQKAIASALKTLATDEDAAEEEDEDDSEHEIEESSDNEDLENPDEEDDGADVEETVATLDVASELLDDEETASDDDDGDHEFRGPENFHPVDDEDEEDPEDDASITASDDFDDDDDPDADSEVIDDDEETADEMAELRASRIKNSKTAQANRAVANLRSIMGSSQD